VAQSGQKEEGEKEMTVKDVIGAMRITRLSFGALGFVGVDGGGLPIRALDGNRGRSVLRF
jgi:hypothetical protein